MATNHINILVSVSIVKLREAIRSKKNSFYLDIVIIPLTPLKGPAQCHVPAGAQALAVILAFSRFGDLYCRLNPERYIHTSYRISESTSRVTPCPRYWGAILYTCFVRVEIGQKCYKA